MSLEKKISSIFEASKNLGYNQYPSMLSKIKELNASDNDLFPILWLEATGQQEIEKHVYQSAYTLYNLNIKCQVSLKDALLQATKEWDISIEEVPWYLVNQFSKKEISDMIAELNLANDVRGKTILYWIENEKK